jgi:hypothetical protein
MVEARTIGVNLIGQIEPNLRENLPRYKRSTPEERSREMQAAAFGQVDHVSEDDYQELIGNVRTIRTWLKEHGKTTDAHPEYRGTEHEIHWIKDKEDPQSPYISVEPKPWEQQSGRNLEPYPKFTVEDAIAGNKVQFELNFDDTYYLSIGKGNGAIHFVSSHLSRREMTKQEYAIVRITIREATSRYAIPL